MEQVQLSEINRQLDSLSESLGYPNISYAKKLSIIKMMQDLRALKQQVLTENRIRLITVDGELV